MTKRIVNVSSLFVTLAIMAVALAATAPAHALVKAGAGVGGYTPTRLWAPGTYDPPPPPLGFTIDGWDVTTVTMSWWNNLAADTTIVQRELGGSGIFVTLATWGPLASGTQTTFTDTGATSDSSNCYRVLAGNANGWSAWSWPAVRCVYTHDGRNITVDRVELFVRIADVSDAGTDDSVQARLQSPAWLVNWRPAGNASWVDTIDDDDFDRGVARWYELLAHNITDLTDITEITLDKPGSDAMCVAEVALRVNRNTSGPGMVVFRRMFGETNSTCRWVTQSSPLTMTVVDLHAAPEWQAATAPIVPTAGIAAEWLRAQIQAAFADSTHGTDARLGGWSLTTKVSSPTRLHVQVPLIVDTLLGDVSTTASFDLDLENTCADGVLRATLRATNVDAFSVFDTLPVLDLVESILFNGVLWHVSEAIESSLHFTSVIDIKTGACDRVLHFKADGSIGLVYL